MKAPRIAPLPKWKVDLVEKAIKLIEEEVGGPATAENIGRRIPAPVRLADDGKRLLPDFAIRHDVLRTVEIQLVDLISWDKTHQCRWCACSLCQSLQLFRIKVKTLGKGTVATSASVFSLMWSASRGDRRTRRSRQRQNICGLSLAPAYLSKLTPADQDPSADYLPCPRWGTCFLATTSP
jgi:hypothetical protein